MQEANQFFAFVNEREHIRIAKESGAPQFMWTQDPVLQKYRFCNVFREDDRTTRYFARTVRDPLRNKTEALIATIGWRWFNRIETCARVTTREWATADTGAMRAALRDVSPVVTGAYVIKTPTGMCKLEGILDSIDRVVVELAKPKFLPCSLEAWHAELTHLPYIGRFMAYEVVTDLRHTAMLENATDTMTWASAGPGCCRGAGWVRDGFPDSIRYPGVRGQESAMNVMRALLEMSLTEWDYPDRPWEMREVEHCLCEYDKYRRAQGGQRLKRKYQ